MTDKDFLFGIFPDTFEHSPTQIRILEIGFLIQILRILPRQATTDYHANGNAVDGAKSLE